MRVVPRGSDVAATDGAPVAPGDTRPMIAKPLASTAALGLLLAAAGCGSSDNGDDSSNASPASSAPATTAAPAAPAAASGDVTIRMNEYSFSPKNAIAKSGKVV